MKFFTPAAVLCLAATSWAANTAVGTIDTVTANLAVLLPQYEAAINASIGQIQNAVSASVIVQAEAAANANLDAIASALASARDSVLASTVNAAGGITAAATGLAQSDIATLASDLAILVRLVQGIGATIVVFAGTSADVQAAVSTELSAARQAVQPFAAPIELFIRQVLQSYAGAAVTVTGLANAETDFETVVNSFGGTVAKM